MWKNILELMEYYWYKSILHPSAKILQKDVVLPFFRYSFAVFLKNIVKAFKKLRKHFLFKLDPHYKYYLRVWRGAG